MVALMLLSSSALAVASAAAQGLPDDIEALPSGSTAAEAVVVEPRPPLGHDLPQPVFEPGAPYTDLASAAALPEQRVTTLRQAIAHSYQNNPRLLAERAALRSADYRYPAARSSYGPRLDAFGSYAFTRNRSELVPGTFIGSQGWTSTAGLVASLPVFTFGRNSAAESAALAEVSFRRDVLRITEAEQISGVIQTYVVVLRDATAVAIAEENLRLLERELNDSRERFRFREITSSDFQQVETRVELGRAQLLAARGQLGASQAEFLRFVGLHPGELQPPDLLSLPVTTLEEAYAVADVGNPVIRSAQSREKLSRAGLEAAKAEFLPRVDVRGTADYGTVSPYTDDLRTTQLRGDATLTLPLIDSGRRSAELGRAREANDADWRLIEAAFRETRSAVASAWNNLAAARSSLERYRLASEAALRAYEGAVVQERAGLRTTLDVLDLARDLLNVRTNYNIALANEHLSRVDLLFAMGRLEAPLLVGEVEAYDPTSHFQRVRNNGDIPLLTPLLSAIDSLTVGDIKTDRPLNDPAAALATGSAVPLRPDEAATPPAR